MNKTYLDKSDAVRFEEEELVSMVTEGTRGTRMF